MTIEELAARLDNVRIPCDNSCNECNGGAHTVCYLIEEAIKELRRLKNVEARLEKLKGVTLDTLLTFQGDCIRVARENLLESHLTELARVFAAVMIDKPYADVTKEEIDTILTVEEVNDEE